MVNELKIKAIKNLNKNKDTQPDLTNAFTLSESIEFKKGDRIKLAVWVKEDGSHYIRLNTEKLNSLGYPSSTQKEKP